MCKHTQLPGPVQPREEVKGDSAKDRWLSSWKSQATFNFMKEFSAVIIKKMLFGGLGDMFGALIKAFWPPKFSKEQSIMKMLMEWTQNYVQMTLEKEIKEDIAAKMCTLKRQAEEVEICTDTLLQKIKKLLGLSQNLFPERRFVSGFFRRLLAYVTPCIISISIMPHISIQHVSCQYVSIQLYPTRIPPISIPSICIHSVRIRSKGMHQQEWQCM